MDATQREGKNTNETQATEKADQARVKADEAEAAHRKAHKVWADAFLRSYIPSCGRESHGRRKGPESHQGRSRRR